MQPKLITGGKSVKLRSYVDQLTNVEIKPRMEIDNTNIKVCRRETPNNGTVTQVR